MKNDIIKRLMKIEAKLGDIIMRETGQNKRDLVLLQEEIVDIRNLLLLMEEKDEKDSDF